MPEPCLVYVAGPYTQPFPAINALKAIAAADELVDRGFTPFVPHLSLLWDTASPKPYGFWLAYDLAWLAKCDALLRLPGESPGADREVARAHEFDIPVFHTIDDLDRWTLTR